MQQEVSAKWKEMKKLKDADLEIAVDTEILKLKKVSTKNKVQGMAVWCKFVSSTANEKSSSSGGSQDVEAVAVLLAPAENASQSSSSDQPTDSQTQAAATKEVKTRPTPKQDELKENMGIEKDILLGLYRKREHLSSQVVMSSKKKSVEEGNVRKRVESGGN